jgi:chromosome segregation ATPase
MTFEEMELGLMGLQDNMTVQGVLMHRLEIRLEDLTSVVVHNSEAIAKLAEGIIAMQAAIKSSAENLISIQAAIRTLTERIDALTDRMDVMQTSMHNLFEHMDRFIRGLESDGHKGGKKKGRS